MSLVRFEFICTQNCFIRRQRLILLTKRGELRKCDWTRPRQLAEPKTDHLENLLAHYELFYGYFLNEGSPIAASGPNVSITHWECLSGQEKSHPRPVLSYVCWRKVILFRVPFYFEFCMTAWTKRPDLLGGYWVDHTELFRCYGWEFRISSRCEFAYVENIQLSF